MATTRTRLTPIQHRAMTEAASAWRGRLPYGLSNRTLGVLEERGLVYAGDYRRGRRLADARGAGYTGFPNYYLTRSGYAALGMDPWLTCTQCGTGHYAPMGQWPGYRCTAGCGHEITRAELALAPGESVDLRDGRLALLWSEPTTGTPATDAGDCGQCDNVLMWDGTGRRVHDVHGEYLCSTGRDSQATSAVHVRRGTPVATVPAQRVPQPEAEAKTVLEDEPGTEGAAEQQRQLAESVTTAGGTFHADGTRVVRLYVSEAGPIGEEFVDRCPCCDDQYVGTTDGMVTVPEEPEPLQRVRWDDGDTSAWPPHLLRLA